MWRLLSSQLRVGAVETARIRFKCGEIDEKTFRTLLGRLGYSPIGCDEEIKALRPDVPVALRTDQNFRR